MTNEMTGIQGIVEAGERVRDAVAQWPPASGDRERWARWDELLTGIGDINGQLVDLTAELVDQRNKAHELLTVWRKGLQRMADEPDRPGPDHARLAKMLLAEEGEEDAAV